MSSINSTYSSVTRMSGLSGLDVDGMVSQLMQLERTKVDTVSKSKQTLLWKQEKYREITSALQGLNNDYFNALKPANDMRNSSIYNAFAMKYDGLDTNSFFTASAGSGAKAGSYTVSNIITAATAKVYGSAAAGDLKGEALTAAGISSISSANANNVFSVEFNGVKKEITLADGLTNISGLAADLQDKLDAAFGSNKITVAIDSDSLTFTTSNTNTLKFSGAENGGLAAIGMYNVNKSNKLSLDANIYDIKNSFSKPLTVDGSDDDISFTINDKPFTFSSKTTSMSKIMAEVNADTEAGVKMSYDSLNNKFIIESRKTGETASDSSGGLLGALSINASDVTGRDASITYDDGVNGEQTITRSSNSFNVSGITFNLKKDYVGSVDLSVSSDPSKAVEMIKGFVSKYNEVLDKINSMISEKRNYDYSPLTDDQKDAMTEEDIKKWEEKAKSGLLGNDSILSSIVSGLRNAVIERVGSTGLTLASIGIKSNSWADKGKLSVNEEKLKNALSENPDEVYSLFTKQSDVLYNTAAASASSKRERFEESGLIYRISDVIQDNIRTSTVNNHRGALLEKAGMTGDRSLFNNSLYEQISDYDKRIAYMNDELILKENSYYSQFSQLETLISNMNSQSTWLSQQFR